MARAGRLVVPAILGVVAVGASVMAVRAGPPPTPTGEPVAAPAAGAPLLSARRVPTVLAEQVASRRLRDGLDAVIATDPDPSCLTVGAGDRTIYESSPDRPLTPASTLKLLTGRAALAELGPETRFRTDVVAGSPPTGGVVEGDLWLIGGGDPVLATRPWAEHFPRQPTLSTPLDVLADRVRDAGVREIRGAVTGDESRYDDRREVATWPSRYRASGQTGPLSALSVDDGFLWPGGTAFADPAAGAAAVLTRLLQERGVVVVGVPRSGRAPDGAHRVASVESPTVAQIVGHMLLESDNGTAEMLTKEIGLRVAGDGSTAAGTTAIRDHLEASDLPVEGLLLLDGSGLDPGNRLTCGLLQRVLDDADPGSALVSGLPVGGRTGTLSVHFVDDSLADRIRAKTGSLNTVAALAGYAEDGDDPTLTFAYVVNGKSRDDDPARLYDALGRVLVDYPDAPDLEVLGPSAYPAPA